MARIQEQTRWAGAITHMKLPHLGMEPPAFIVILQDTKINDSMTRFAIGADTTETVIPSALYERLLRTAAFYPKRLDEVEKIMERVSPELVDDSFRMLIRTFREAVKRR